MDKRLEDMKILDESFVVEAFFFRSMLGQRGKDAIVERVMAQLPDVGTAKTVRGVISAIGSIQEGGLWQFVDDTVRTPISDFIKMLDAMLSGEAPPLSAKADGVTVAINSAS